MELGVIDKLYLIGRYHRRLNQFDLNGDTKCNQHPIPPRDNEPTVQAIEFDVDKPSTALAARGAYNPKLWLVPARCAPLWRIQWARARFHRATVDMPHIGSTSPW